MIVDAVIPGQEGRLVSGESRATLNPKPFREVLALAGLLSAGESAFLCGQAWQTSAYTRWAVTWRAS